MLPEDESAATGRPALPIMLWPDAGSAGDGRHVDRLDLAGDEARAPEAPEAAKATPTPLMLAPVPFAGFADNVPGS